jgi:phosphoglucosamine mutase
MKRKGKPLSELSKVMTTFPQVLVNVDVKARKDLQAIPEIKQAIDDAEKKMKGKGRVLVRFSGTQLICRVMVEGPSKKEITELADAVASLIEKHIG